MVQPAGLPLPAWPPQPRTIGTAAEGLVRLKDTWLRMYPFETRRCGEARTCPPRTVGHTCLVLDGGPRGLDWLGAEEAVAVALRTEEPRCPEAAREKVVFCNPRGETLLYQADRHNRSAALCACGNASGSAAALLAHHLNMPRVRQRVKLPDGQVQMHADVARTGAGAWRVQQSWSGIRLQALEATLGGREVAIGTGTLNDYLVVRLSDRQELEAFGLEEVLGLWYEARRYSGFEDPLQSRLVAIAPGGSRPYARFYTCGRMHPGAPLTGLALLALAAGQVDWLASLLRVGQIEHRRGIDSLPAVRTGRGGTEVQFTGIDVILHGM